MKMAKITLFGMWVQYSRPEREQVRGGRAEGHGAQAWRPQVQQLAVARERRSGRAARASGHLLW